ncbi:MAG: biopolymer transporter ExbD [Sandaracinaceae bacterium]|jgi:biopolymer transport protein ExbD|nr:biopolymer transporter ExbD [Sandaracinaceae bacterium]
MSEAHPEHPKKAKMSTLKRLIRRAKAKHPEHEEMGLNIYPMMDMMTILLVFLIMQFATTQANVVESAELHFPISTSQQEAKTSVAITVSANGVLVEGRQALPLRNGVIDPSMKQGGGNGFLITPLLTVMQQHRDRLKLIARANATRPFLGDIQLIADVNTPYNTITAILYTCGQAEFSKVHFLVKKATQPHAAAQTREE